MGRASVLMILFGLGSVALGIEQRGLYVKSSADPHTITAKELAEKGPGPNFNVVLEKYLISQGDFVYQYKKNPDKWTAVFVPIRARSGPYRQKIGIILKSTKIKSVEDINKLEEVSSLQGLVINDIESLGTEEKRLLSESYPEADFNKVWIFEHNRKPPSGAVVFGQMLVGVALFAGGVLKLVKKKS